MWFWIEVSKRVKKKLLTHHDFITYDLVNHSLRFEISLEMCHVFSKLKVNGRCISCSIPATLPFASWTTLAAEPMLRTRYAKTPHYTFFFFCSRKLFLFLSYFCLFPCRLINLQCSQVHKICQRLLCVQACANANTRSIANGSIKKAREQRG